MERKIHVGIVEDELDIAENYQLHINRDSAYTCDHIFATAEEALCQIPKLQLDVVLADIGLPDKSGIECIAFLKPRCPQIEFLICTSFEDTDSVFEALKAGATGYMTKSDSLSKLMTAIAEVHNGGSPMSSHIARKVVSYFHLSKENTYLNTLSFREQEILQYLSKGFRYKEIADILFISIETVRTHIRNIYQKLQVSSRTDAINKAYRK